MTLDEHSSLATWFRDSDFPYCRPGSRAARIYYDIMKPVLSSHNVWIRRVCIADQVIFMNVYNLISRIERSYLLALLLKMEQNRKS